MKRVLPMMLALTLLLTACGARQETAPMEETPKLPETAQEAKPQKPGAELFLEMEREVYDPSLTSYTYFVRNGTDETVEFGSDYAVQRQVADGWQNLTFRENAGFTAVGYSLEPGGTMALTCGLSLFQETPEAGRYRLVKTVGEQTLCAEFELGESPYTVAAPYGFAPLEELPEDYGADTASAADVVFTDDGVENETAVEEFLYKVGLNVPCQLRVIQDYGENTPMVTDAVYENGHFLWRMRMDGEVYQQRLSYLVTDGESLYLSNGADWPTAEKYMGKELVCLVPEKTMTWLAPTVEQMTAARLEGNSTRYRVWSADGEWDAMLTENPMEFGVGWQKPGAGSRGSLYDLNRWDGLETAILGLDWWEDGRLLLICETADGGTSQRFFNPETEELT